MTAPTVEELAAQVRRMLLPGLVGYPHQHRLAREALDVLAARATEAERALRAVRASELATSQARDIADAYFASLPSPPEPTEEETWASRRSRTGCCPRSARDAAASSKRATVTAASQSAATGERFYETRHPDGIENAGRLGRPEIPLDEYLRGQR